MPLRPRRGVESLQLCYHGGPDYAELESKGISVDGILDFSSNTNPFGPPPGISESLAKVDISQYPDSDATDLRRKLASILGISPNNIIVGSGSTELLRLIALAYLNVEDAAVIIEPTFGEYEMACRVVGASVVKDTLSADNLFRLDVQQMISSMGKNSPKIIFLCNPNNPTGQYLSRDELEQLLNAAQDCLVVIDEAYVAFVDHAWPSMDLVERDNCIILRSMTKDFALTGLRLGYALAREDIIEILRRVCPPWNVNILAQRAGLLALESSEYVGQCSAKLKEAKDYLVKELSRVGYDILPSSANFFMMKVGNAATFREYLLGQGILVRDCASFGLSEYIRIAPRSLPECQKLVATIERRVA